MSTNDLQNLHPKSLAARDHSQQQTTGDIAERFARAARDSGRSPAQMIKEVKQAANWPGRMTQLDYLNARLYEMDKSQRKEFISDWLHWPIHEFCKDDEWSEKTVDKWQCTEVLADAGIPTIPIVAVVDRSDLDYGNTPRITNAAQMAAFLAAAELPLFAKPNRLLGSFGALRIEDLDGDDVIVNSGERVSVENLISELMSDVPYVLQQVVANHSTVREFAEGLATLRTVNLVSDGKVRLDRCVFKIPAAGNIADNAWRSGNLVANVDPHTGTIDRVVQGSGPEMVAFTHHPDTKTALVGMQLPWWDEVLALNTRTAELFGAISYQSQDIAITDEGPIVVEVNSGSSFELPQVVSGKGFLTYENRKFFESCGVNFRKLSLPD